MNDIYDVKYLLEYCESIPQLYNEVSNHLWNRFGIKGAEITLLITYYINEERRKHEKEVLQTR